MENVDLEKFNVDSDLQSIADAMTVAGLNFCGGVFDHLETGEEFALTISKCSGIKDLRNNHDRLVEENAELREMVKGLKSAADEVTKYKHALSYNESYAGEPVGELKNNLAELDMVSCKASQLLSKYK